MPARLVPMAVGRTAVAVSGLAELGVVHRLTRGRLWIGALATLLVGIVAINVLALSFNATASRTGQQTDVLKRQVSTLRAQIAAAGASNERVQSEAAKLGLIVPEPGAIGYLSPSADDAAVAAKRLASGALTIGAPVATPAAPTATVASAPPPVPATTAATTPAQPAPSPAAAAPQATTTATTTPTTSAGSTSTTAAVASAQPASGGGTSSGGGVATP